MATKLSAKRRAKADGYMDLVRRFPLKPIRDDAGHAEAVEIVAEFMGRDVDGGTSDYLDTLILLVNKYEDDNHTPRGTDLSPQEALSGDHERQRDVAGRDGQGDRERVGRLDVPERRARAFEGEHQSAGRPVPRRREPVPLIEESRGRDSCPLSPVLRGEG